MIATQAMLAVISGSQTAGRVAFVTGTLIFLGLAVPCLAFAWDGLVRRRMLWSAFPVGAALGDQARLVRRVWACVIGFLCLLGGLIFLVLAFGTWLIAAERQCQGQTSLACAGTLVVSAEWYAWAWFGMWVLWFVIVWLRMGDPRKRVLVYGVWYRQERVAREINQQLQARGLVPLPGERLYALEEAVLGLMRAGLAGLRRRLPG